MKVPVQIEGVEFRMEVDTGAAASILYYTDYERYFKYLAVRPSRNIIPLLCWCTVGHCRTDCMHRTVAAMPIYARYFPVISLALFMSASILVDFSRLYKVSHFEEATLRVHQSRVSFAWSESYLYCGWCAYGLSMNIFVFSLPVKLK